jgi:photosynthetic reaction center cytochrome c subunit
MIHMSEGLGVNCTYCHNSRAFASWEQSPPQRVTAWHGIRMVQALNAGFLDPLRPTYPASRLGPTGDAPKANCATCHQGAYKPLYGAPLAKDHPELTVPNPQGQGPQPFRSSASR